MALPRVVYARTPLPDAEKSIFLAGPTPRSPEVKSWRPRAILTFGFFKFNGALFVPEDAEGGMRGSKKEQREWEWEALERATCIMFWVPRGLKDLPGFTTNIEFGLYVKSDKSVFGAPRNAPKTSYMRALCERFDKPAYYTLDYTIEKAIEKVESRSFGFPAKRVTSKKRLEELEPQPTEEQKHKFREELERIEEAERAPLRDPSFYTPLA